jgi:hypothetical protein
VRQSDQREYAVANSSSAGCLNLVIPPEAIFAQQAPGAEPEHQPPAFYDHCAFIERRKRGQPSKGTPDWRAGPGEWDLAAPHPERHRRPVEKEAQLRPRVLRRRLWSSVLGQVAVQVRDLEVAPVICAALHDGKDVVNGCSERVVVPYGLFGIYLQPVRIFSSWLASRTVSLAKSVIGEPGIRPGGGWCTGRAESRQIPHTQPSRSPIRIRSRLLNLATK